MGSKEVANRMAFIAGNKAFMDRIRSFNRAEIVPNRSYWHYWNGNPYCHYRDGWGCDWYGWGCGAGFFWAQYYWGDWWWCDPWAGNWCYWNDGYWWWQNPWDTTVYVYENGDYVPADNNGDGGYAQQPPSAGNGGSSALADNVELRPKADKSGMKPEGMLKFRSPDGSRTVKVTEDGDAFLYDTSGLPHPAKPLYLASKVAAVKFPSAGKGSLNIQLILKGGKKELFDANGVPLGGMNT
jgi:hypothetical protein